MIFFDWLASNWWRFFCPISAKWIRHGSRINYVTTYRIYIFGIRIAVIQTSDPST